MSRVFAYLRVSTEHQSKGDQNGLTAQTDSINAWCEANGISPLSVLWCRDEGVSGAAALSQRPALRELLYELKDGDIVVVSSLCRLSRDLMNSLMMEEEFKRKKAKLISVKGEGTESESPEATLMKRILQVMSSYERELIKSRTSAALQSRKRRGLRTGQVPYGFTVGKDGKKLITVDKEIQVLFEVEHLREAGHSYQFICDEFSSRGILNRRNNQWSRHNLRVCFKGWMNDGKNRFYRLQNSSWS